MDSGRCTNCARPFSAGEITGLGILRSRPESEGGPLMEFSCPRCGFRMLLIPYGQARYALPGQPPPPPVPEAERAPYWVRRATDPDAAPPPASPPPPPPPPPPPEPEPIEEPLQVEVPVVDPDAPLTVPLALELLGLEPTAERSEIERAYRARSRTCHPDKVAHLDLDFQELAERKFKRLQRAYELLLG